MWERAVSCSITAVGVFCHGRMERSLFVYLPRCQGANELSPPIWGMLSPSRLSWCWVSTATEAWNAPGSQAVQYEWPFGLVFFVFFPFRQACLASSAIQINTGWHTHTCENSYMLLLSLQSSSGCLEFFLRGKMGRWRVISNRDRKVCCSHSEYKLKNQLSKYIYNPHTVRAIGRNVSFFSDFPFTVEALKAFWGGALL